MRERLRIAPGSNGSIPVQRMVDFNKAIDTYTHLLRSNGVPVYDIEKAVSKIRDTNNTRKQGNGFINLMQEVTRPPKA